MKRSWSEDTNARPTFKEIRNDLDEMFVAAPGDDYYYYQKWEKKSLFEDFDKEMLLIIGLWF